MSLISILKQNRNVLMNLKLSSNRSWKSGSILMNPLFRHTTAATNTTTTTTRQQRFIHSNRYLYQQSNSNNNKNNNNNKDKDKENYDKIMKYFKSKEFKKSLLFTFIFSFLYTYVTSLLVGNNNDDESSNGAVLTFQDFKTKYLEKGLVSKIYVINKQYIKAELISSSSTSSLNSGGNHFVTFTIGSIDFFEDEIDKIQSMLGIPSEEKLPIIYMNETSMLQYLLPFVPTVLLLGGLVFISKRFQPGGAGGGGAGNNMFQVGKSKAKLFNQETNIKVQFKDVAGCDEAKQEIMEFVDFLKKPTKYTRLGAKIPRGAILSGPPGTGKTLLAKATAGEANVPFLSVSGSEFVEMFVGVGASRVRDLFSKAREMAPCIIFIDEIDAIGRSRSGGGSKSGGMGGGGGSNDERESTLNQLLVEMDGFENNEQIIVLAGTNRADILDKALLRPGRFDRHVEIDNPDIEGRKSIYKIHLRNLKIDSKLLENLDLLSGKLSALTPGFSGADIANCCNESALIAAREGVEVIEMKHFEQAIERVIAGLEKKTKILSPSEKKIVAYHEAGHAVCGWYLENADPLLKVSIVPRGQGALGYAQYLPDDMNLLNNLQILDRMVMALGGRVSEELHFPNVTSGAHDDFKKVTKMATSMVKSLGMSSRIGYINYDELKNATGGILINKPFSEHTSKKLDSEIKKIIDDCHSKCKELLQLHIEDIEKVAQLLLKKEVLTRSDMIKLLGPRSFKEKNKAFTKYLDSEEITN